MVHVHFDAKYRVDRLTDLFGVIDQDLDLEKSDQSGGQYRRGDLLKMHAYRDAIRRSHGAYVLYPGDAEHTWREYHEIVPGIGAFQLRPGEPPVGLRSFISELLDHVTGRTVADFLSRLEARVYSRP